MRASIGRRQACHELSSPQVARKSVGAGVAEQRANSPPRAGKRRQAFRLRHADSAGHPRDGAHEDNQPILAQRDLGVFYVRPRSSSRVAPAADAVRAVAVRR
jgi:hypothetical protein